MEINFDLIVEYVLDNSAEIILGLEMLLLRLIKNKTPEEKEVLLLNKKHKRLKKIKKKMEKELNDTPCIVDNGGGYDNV